MQKCFTIDFLTKRQKPNEGEYPQYYVEGSHEAIIPPAIHELVQDEIRRRKSLKQRFSTAGLFSNKILCGECGGMYSPKVWHSNDKYRRVVWQCLNKYKSEKQCATPHFSEEEIMNAFVSAFNKYIQNRAAIADSIEETVAGLIESSDLDEQIKKHAAKCDAIAESVKECVKENTSEPLDQKAYERRYNALVKQYEGVAKKIEELETLRQQREAKCRHITRCLDVIRETDTTLTEFDEKMWQLLLESVTAYSRDRFVFQFVDGTEIVESVDK